MKDIKSEVEAREEMLAVQERVANEMFRKEGIWHELGFKDEYFRFSTGQVVADNVNKALGGDYVKAGQRVDKGYDHGNVVFVEEDWFKEYLKKEFGLQGTGINEYLKKRRVKALYDMMLQDAFSVWSIKEEYGDEVYNALEEKIKSSDMYWEDSTGNKRLMLEADLVMILG
jgi:hypothetical protein